MSNDRMFLVTNRSASVVFYSVPEIGVKSRMFQPNETKKISYEELEGLNYQPGGPALIRDYLQIKNAAVRDEFVGKVEPEYNMTPEQIKELILHGSQDEWLDCLDFAPEGVIDLLKELSVELPLTDTRKMQAFQEKRGIDLANAIKIRQEEKAEERVKNETAAAPQRRVAAEPAPTTESVSTRRTSGSKYTVVKRDSV